MLFAFWSQELSGAPMRAVKIDTAWQIGLIGSKARRLVSMLSGVAASRVLLSLQANVALTMASASARLRGGVCLLDVVRRRARAMSQPQLQVRVCG